ncbi:MAG: YdcF family protein [Oscillospiraceae bacterium]|nr:YdcF family protein [Oscillospiraceae bacterium]
MKKLAVFAALFGAAGIVMVILPLHMQMTGLVLLLLAAVMGLSAILWRHPTKLRQKLIQIMAVAAATGVVVLMSVMNIITTSGQSDWDRAETSEYAVVLGAAVNVTGGPSRIMRNRLAAAMEFMERNPHALVILSGGQGGDEPKTEAKCMYDTLLSMGADESRLLLEEQSHTTRENLLSSYAIIESMGGTEKPIALITSEFHQRRADFIADALGLDTCPVSAHTDRWFYRVNYTLREVFAFVKAMFQSGAE